MSEPKNPTASVLTQALEQQNKVVNDRNVAKVAAEIEVIRYHKAEIVTHEKAIAEAQKNIRTIEAEPKLTAKQVLGS